jgi:hypothetical protein
MIRHNYLGLFLLAMATLAAGFGWGMNIWGGWSESAYERLKKSGSTWFWLRLFKIEQSQRNCIRFLKIASAFGLFVVVPVVLFNIAHFVSTR